MDTNYDVGWYHLPFAARIWQIIPVESFTSVERIEDRYDGFPLLANFLQGLLWKVTGRIEATRLVGYSSIIVYLFFLRSYLQIPFYISAIAIFTIPAVLTHAPGGFVDLPGNIGVSIGMMIAYNLFRQSRLPTKKELWMVFLGLGAAANIKPQLQPLVFVLWLLLGIRLLWLYLKHSFPGNRHLGKKAILIAIASSLIFFTPVKNAGECENLNVIPHKE